MHETDLAKPVIAWLIEQHWDVYQEVQFGYGGCVADIVARRNNVLWIIECKTSYTFDVLEQATRWPVHFRSVAVPRVRALRDYRVARNYYEVGVIEVDGERVKEYVDAPFFRRDKYVKRFLDCLTELHKTYAEAGSKSGNHLTPYKQTMIEVRKLIENNPGCTIGFLYDQLGNMHYLNKLSFKGNLVKALVSFERNWCRVDTTNRPYTLFVEEK